MPRLILISISLLLFAACSKQEPSSSEGGPPLAVTGSAPSVSGEKLFMDNCATCHMADGGGVPNLQPPIAGSAWISAPDPQLLLTLILRGSAVLGEAATAFDNDMAPLAHLTDAEIAALATYTRQRFASSPPPNEVTPAEVALARSRPGLP